MARWTSSAGRDADERGELVQLGAAPRGDDGRHDRDLGDDLTVSKIACGPKRFFAPVSGLSFLGSGLSAWADGLEADLSDARDHAGDHAGDARPGATAIATCTPTLAEQPPMPCWTRRSGVAISCEDARASRPPCARHRRAAADEHDQPGHQHDGAVDVHRARDLALLAGLLALLGCCLLGLVAGQQPATLSVRRAVRTAAGARRRPSRRRTAAWRRPGRGRRRPWPGSRRRRR